MQSLSQLEKKGNQRKFQLDFPCQPYPNFIPCGFRSSIDISFLESRLSLSRISGLGYSIEFKFLLLMAVSV